MRAGHQILETLRSNLSSPADQAALRILKDRMPSTGADMPDWLSEREPNSDSAKGRWRREPARNHRIGMVVEAMATGTNVLGTYGRNKRIQQQLQSD